jgi:hypothetical protein
MKFKINEAQDEATNFASKVKQLKIIPDGKAFLSNGDIKYKVSFPNGNEVAEVYKRNNKVNIEFTNPNIPLETEDLSTLAKFMKALEK